MFKRLLRLFRKRDDRCEIELLSQSELDMIKRYENKLKEEYSMLIGMALREQAKKFEERQKQFNDDLLAIKFENKGW